MKKKKELKFWNGGGWMYCGDHVYIAAYSRMEAARIYCQAENKHRNRPYAPDKSDIDRIYRSMKDYFSPVWGTSMKGIEPELGLWYVEKYNSNKPPTRII